MKKVCIKTFNHRADAELVVALLESKGIETRIVADDCGGAEPQLSMLKGIGLEVDAADVEKAKEIIASAQENYAPDPELERKKNKEARGREIVTKYMRVFLLVILIFACVRITNWILGKKGPDRKLQIQRVPNIIESLN